MGLCRDGPAPGAASARLQSAQYPSSAHESHQRGTTPTVLYVIEICPN
jgi:hypothetical protein